MKDFVKHIMKRKWIAAVVAVIVITTIILLCATGNNSDNIKKDDGRVDSVSLFIATMPTMDCMPIFLSLEDSLFQVAGLPVKIKTFFSQMDCDTALAGGSVHMAFTDVVRAQRLIRKKVPLQFYSSTPLAWQMIANRHTRIRQLSDLDEKMVAMTRFSATDMLAEAAIDSSKLAQEKVYRVQINDVGIRLRMLLNNEMDVVMLPEPFITEAKNVGNRTLVDFSNNYTLGALVVRTDLVQSKTRQAQLEKFNVLYNAAVDSLNKNGVKYYASIIKKYCKVKSSTIDSLKSFKYSHITSVDESNILLAQKWLDKH